MSIPMNESARQQVLECLRELADAEFQERVWVRGEGPEVSSFSELVSQLFDDTTLGDRLESGETVFGRDADAVLNELSLLLDCFDANIDPDALLRHPRWTTVRQVAARAVELIEKGEG